MFRTALFDSATLPATCEANNYTITYNLDGGTNYDDAPTTYTIETDTIILGIPTKDGYVFAGWYDNAEFDGIPVTQIAKGSTGDKTFYAKWDYACESGKWFHIGNNKICMYSEQQTHPSMAIDMDGTTYYIMLSADENMPMNNNTTSKMHIEYDGQTYNAYDGSVY